MISVCKEHSIDVPYINGYYVERRGWACHQREDVIIEHHYQVNTFLCYIYSQLPELNNHQFCEHTVELLILTSALNPWGTHESFKIDDICLLVYFFYPLDFIDYEK